MNEGYKNLEVYRTFYDLARDIHFLTLDFPGQFRLILEKVMGGKNILMILSGFQLALCRQLMKQKFILNKPVILGIQLKRNITIF